MIVKSGEVVTPKVKAALDELKNKAALGQLGFGGGTESRAANATEAQWRLQAQEAREIASYERKRNLWITAGFMATLILSSFTIWQLVKARRSRVLLPLALGQGASTHAVSKAVLPCPSCAEPILVNMPAEGRPTAEILPSRDPFRDALSPESQSRWPSWLQQLRKAVGGLLWQRAVLLDTYRAAEMELTALEKRLAKINAPLQDRIEAYEGRITQLEQQLGAQRKENSEIIKAQIHLAKRKLESERKKSPIGMG